MEKQIKLGIVIITYNFHDAFLKQVERIKRHCKDDFDIIIVDNSTEKETIEFIEYHANQQGCIYLKTNSSSINSSSSHAFAANFSQIKFGADYDLFQYLDHDCFPIKDYSVNETLGDDFVMAGIGQEKSKKYLWPGCLMFKSGLGIDFSPNHKHKLDTGGNIYRTIELYPDKILYFNEAHTENPEFTKNRYNFYSLINNGMFMHFINGSGWNDAGHQEERINSLLNVLDKK